MVKDKSLAINGGSRAVPALKPATVAGNVAQPPSAVQGPFAKPGPTQYRRTLPHLQALGKSVFVAFCTKDRWFLPESVRATVLRHCLRDDGRKYQAHAVVVMPDHVHMIMTTYEDTRGNTFKLSEILNGIKGASAHSINKALGRKGHVWQDESFDHVLRSNESLYGKCRYVCENPARKGLAATPEEWPWRWNEWMAVETSTEKPRTGRAQPGAAVPHADW